MCPKTSSSDFLMLIPGCTVILLSVEKWQLYFKGLFQQSIFLSPFLALGVIILTDDREELV